MLAHDIGYGMRLVRRRPGFAVVAAMTLALGIGTATAVFSVADRVLLRPVPYPDPDRLVVVWETSPRIPLPVMYASPPNLHDWQQRARSFTAMGGFQWRNVTLGGDEPEQIRAARVTAGLLRALGVQPRLGRLFVDEEDRDHARPVVIVSDAFWRQRLQQSPTVLGQTVVLDGIPTEIVGVMPPGFVCPPGVVLRGAPPADPAELWVPHGTNLEAGQRGAHYLAVIARLAPGVGVDAAGREMTEIQAQIEREHPDYREWRARVVPLIEQVTATSRQSVTLLTAAVGFVLLLACANVANLLVARGVGRRREFAIRSALGAGRGRLAVQVLVESAMLSAAGGLLGLVVAAALLRSIAILGPATVPGLRDVRMDLRALACAGIVAGLAAVLASVVPALGTARARAAEWLADRSGGTGPAGTRVQRALSIGQIGLAVALLVVATLLVESVRQLQAADAGFRPDRVVTGKVTLPDTRYPDGAARVRFVDRLLDSVRQSPGVAAAGLIDAVPVADNRQGTSFAPADEPDADPEQAPTANVAWISDGYFDAMGIPLVAGRTFTERDRLDSPRVVIVNERLARQVYGGRDAVGRQVRVGASANAPFEIIGIVGDEHHAGVDVEAPPSFFLSYRQQPTGRELALVVRAAADGTAPTAGLRAAIRGLDAELAFFQVRTMVQVMDTATATPRAVAWLLSGFALSGLLLAGIGIFGVLSHAVGQRTREIGVRVAVGASPRSVVWMVARAGLLQVAAGLVPGLAAAWLLSRLLSGLLFGVSMTDPAPYLIVAGVIGLVAVAACVVPVRRALAVDPVAALRSD